MAIYTRFGSRVQFLTADLLKVWTTLGDLGDGEGYRLAWHYSEPKRTKKWRKGVETDVMNVWHVTTRYDDDRPGHGGTKPISGSRPISDYVADGAIQEIIAECHRLNPAHAAKEAA